MHKVTFSAFKPVRILLIGTGGTGSLLLTHLLRIDQGVRALGGAGLHVQAFDPDTVSQTNLIRQNFAPSDVGRNKAVVLVERCNLYAGLRWDAQPRRLTKADFQHEVQLLITCVDSGQSRREVHDLLAALPHHQRPHYWLDCGNEARTGQVILGQPRQPQGGLPSIIDLDPTAMQGQDDDRPSCSAIEALTRQHPFINPEVALRAAQIIGEMLYHGVVTAPAIFVNLEGNVRTVAQELGTPRPRKVEALIPFPKPAQRPRSRRASRTAATN